MQCSTCGKRISHERENGSCVIMPSGGRRVTLIFAPGSSCPLAAEARDVEGPVIVYGPDLFPGASSFRGATVVGMTIEDCFGLREHLFPRAVYMTNDDTLRLDVSVHWPMIDPDWRRDVDDCWPEPVKTVWERLLEDV